MRVDRCVQGEHRLYEPDGTLKEVRPTGMYKSSPPGDIHREGGSTDQDVVLFFDMRGHDGRVLRNPRRRSECRRHAQLRRLPRRV